MAKSAALAITIFALWMTADSLNHTVGGAVGWLFNSTINAAIIDYSQWASNRSFFSGDFLIFNGDGNSTVIQTYNETTYHICSLDEDYGNLTSQWTSDEDGGDGGSGGDSVPVLLWMVGENYFFSSVDSGAQCRRGMKFQISVMERVEKPSSEPIPAALPSGTLEFNTSRQREMQLRGDGRRRRAFWDFYFVGALLLLFSG